jgi:uncharacterized protein YdeI (YjbR/CyaY-like superfamily)
MNPAVDKFLDREEKWSKEFEKLREICLSTGLNEELKWGNPCYTYEDRNIVLIHGFKEYCALLFFKGALLNDPDGVLIIQSQNVQSARQIRFTSLSQINKHEQILKSYIYNAVEVEKSGQKVELRKTEDYEVAEEFQAKLNESSALKTAFKALTPGRQRAYLFHFSQAKQSATRLARVEKCIPLIMKGKGLTD